MNGTRIALVTGANKGIGKEIARGLATQGMTVLLGARDAALGQAAAAELAVHGAVLPLQIDITSDSSVGAAYSIIRERYGRLDVLVNNAAVGAARMPPSAVGVDEFRDVFETNLFGVARTINAMLPLLRQAPAGRIVNLSSLRGSLGDPGAFVGQPSVPYSISKTALNALTLHYARELAATPIKINAAAPGHCATDFNGHRGTRTAAEGAAIAILLATLDQDGASGGFFDDNGPLPW